MSRHPEASFEEIAAACFADRDGELNLRAISPRHLEACATRTCQILIEGEYNGILRPHEHYIELRADYSNLDDVLANLGDEARRRRIVDNAYRDVVASGRYSSRRLVEDVERSALGAPARAVRAGPRNGAAFARSVADDRLSVVLLARLRQLTWKLDERLTPLIGQRARRALARAARRRTA